MALHWQNKKSKVQPAFFPSSDLSLSSSLYSLSIVDSCGCSMETLLADKIVAISVVTLFSALLTGCCSCWHAQWHMPGSSAKHRVSLQLKLRLSVVSVAGDFLSTPLPLFTCPPFKHLPRADLEYKFGAQTWPPSLQQFFLND